METTTPEASFTEQLLEKGCCPRCGDEDLRSVRVLYRDGEPKGLRVKHESGGYKKDGCSFVEWAIWDPDRFDDDTSQIGGGLSICQTCCFHVQHITHDGFDDDGFAQWEIQDPPRDEAGQVICTHCDRRTSRGAA